MKIFIEGKNRESEILIYALDQSIREDGSNLKNLEISSENIAKQKPFDGGTVLLVLSAVGTFGGGVASGVLANWIWEKIGKRPEKDQISVSIEINGEKHLLDVSDRSSLEIQIVRATEKDA